MTSVDVALLGATGFTGALTADYLGKRLPEGASWAIAGRNASKLAAIAGRIEAAGGRRPEIIEADTTDDASLAALMAQTRVIITEVGPFLEHGLPVVAAAARAGVDYLDITGEPEFVDRAWLDFNTVARQSGARLIHAAGFDSVPVDLGVFFTVEKFRDAFGDIEGPLTIRGYMRPKILPTAGTVHSIVDMADRWRKAKKVAQTRTNLEGRPIGRKIGGGGRVSRAPGKGIAVPAPVVDPVIARRSARALTAYGPDFRYEHYVAVPGYQAAGAAIGLPVFAAVAQIATARKLIRKAFPAGAGPSERQRAKCSVTVDFYAESAGHSLHTRVSGGDPYEATAAIVGEAAKSLLDDKLPKLSGQLTTAQAFGHHLLDRINPSILRFETL